MGASLSKDELLYRGAMNGIFTCLSKDKLLYKEVMNGNQKRVRALKLAGASLEWMDKEGRTPLSLACTRGNLLEMVRTLITLGAKIDSYGPGAYGQTPLYHAAKEGLLKTVKLLLDCGDPLTRIDDCQTALDMARSRKHVNVVRTIEEHISLFYGTILECNGSGWVQKISADFRSKKIWAVVLPSKIQNPGMDRQFELAIYETEEVSQPRIIISLWEFEIKEPKDLQYPILELVEKHARSSYRFLSAFDGEEDKKRQLRQLYEACRGNRGNRMD